MNERPHAALGEILGTLHAVETRLEAALEPLGLSLAKFKALHTLVTAGEPLPLRTLAEHCACVRSNITQLMDRLEAEGLVKRVDDPDDRRSVYAEITDQGRERLKTLWQGATSLQAGLTGGLSESELVQLRHTCLRLIQTMSAEEAKSHAPS